MLTLFWVIKQKDSNTIGTELQVHVRAIEVHSAVALDDNLNSHSHSQAKIHSTGVNNNSPTITKVVVMDNKTIEGIHNKIHLVDVVNNKAIVRIHNENDMKDKERPTQMQSIIIMKIIVMMVKIGVKNINSKSLKVHLKSSYARCKKTSNEWKKKRDKKEKKSIIDNTSGKMNLIAMQIKNSTIHRIEQRQNKNSSEFFYGDF